MKNKMFFILFISFIVSFISKSQEIGSPIIRNYSTKEYNNAPQVFSIVQDRKGVLYFGCGGSIIEYDGVSWHSTQIDKQATPYEIAIDKNDKIYLAANGEFGYLGTNAIGCTKFFSLTHLIKDSTFKVGTVWTVRLTSKAAYFQTLDAVIQYSFNPEEIRIYKADANDRFSLPFVYIDCYYFKSFNKGLLKIENNSIESVPHAEFFKDIISIVALPFDTATMLIPNGDVGFFLYQPLSSSLPNDFSFSNIEFFKENRIYSGLCYQKAYFALGSLKKGAIIIDKQGSTLQKYDEDNLLQNNSVLGIVADANQNLWFGTNNGISKVENGLDLSYWDKKAGLKNTVYSIIRYNRVVYISTGEGIFFIDKQNQIKEVENVPSGQNWSLLELQNYKLLLAGTSNGIIEIIGDKAIQIYKGGLSTKLYQSLKKPNRILSTDDYFFISLKLENGKWISEGRWEGIKDDIRGIIEDEDGELWLSTYRNGVIRVTPNYKSISTPQKVRYYKEKEGFASLKEILPFKYKDKIVWTTEKGLYYYNKQNDKFEPFCELGEQFCNGSRNIYSIIEGQDGKIWVFPSDNKKGDIGYLQPRPNGTNSWIYAPFRRIPEMRLYSFLVEPNGVAWIGGSEGLYRYDMRKDFKNYKLGFNCLVRRVILNNDSLVYCGSLSSSNDFNVKLGPKIESKFKNIRIEFAAPYFDQENKTQYSYRLIGYNEEWSNWSKEVAKDYTRLFEGAYTFQVKARNVYDCESEIGNFQFTVLPPFYRTWFAYGLYLVLIVIFVLAIVKFYTRILRQQKEHLQEVVDERTTELLHQKEELQAINEELQATLHSLKETQNQLVQSEKMASIGVLASGVVHEINNPLNFIQGGVEGIKSYFERNKPNPSEDIESYIEAATEGVEKVSEIVSGLNHFSRNINFVSHGIEIHGIIDNCLLLIKHLTTGRIEIIKEYTDKPYTLTGNEGNLHQAIFNVLINSVQSIKDKGTVKTKTDIIGDKMCITIIDTGCGIDEENMLKILDPFFTTKEPGEGTGLGLSITFNILKDHGGTISFESILGEGTTAIITLPIKDNEDKA